MCILAIDIRKNINEKVFFSNIVVGSSHALGRRGGDCIREIVDSDWRRGGVCH